jgi:hypothetical protein
MERKLADTVQLKLRVRRPMARKPADTVQLKLRFPEKLRRRIEAAADKNQQSMNAEIVERLEQSFQKDDQASVTATLLKIDTRIGELMREVEDLRTIGEWIRPEPNPTSSTGDKP